MKEELARPIRPPADSPTTESVFTTPAAELLRTLDPNRFPTRPPTLF